MELLQQQIDSINHQRLKKVKPTPKDNDQTHQKSEEFRSSIDIRNLENQNH